MDCPQCQHPSPEGARFCPSCGAGLGSGCRSCGAALAPGARFCTACGAAVEASAARQRSAAHITGERRQLTVTFCDLAGSTERFAPRSASWAGWPS